MKSLNRDLERLALKAITSGKPSGLKLFGQLNKDHFKDKNNQEAFKRIKTIVKKQSDVPSWEDLLDDTSVPEETRLILKNFEKETKINTRRCDEIFQSLDNYRRIRAVFDGTKDIIENQIVNAKAIDIDNVVENLSDVVAKARAIAGDTDFYKIGRDDNVDEVVRKILSSEGGLPCAPSGLKIWDNKNRGIPFGSVMLVGADTGGGKSLAADNFGETFTNDGVKTCFVSLEMDIEEKMIRRLSRYSKIAQSKILNPEHLTDEERKEIYQAYKKRKNFLDEQGKTYFTKVPKGQPSIEELLMQLKPYAFKAIIIDYVSLLKGTQGEDQWRKLGDVLAFSKSYARNENCIIIILVQITKELRLKYSSTMLEHCDLAWFWIKDQMAMDSNIYKITVPKARKQKPFDFYIVFDTDIATVKDTPKDFKPPGPKDMINKELMKKKAANDSGGTKSDKKSKIKDDDLMEEFFGKAGGKI
jgi:replicative DNA helicase